MRKSISQKSLSKQKSLLKNLNKSFINFNKRYNKNFNRNFCSKYISKVIPDAREYIPINVYTKTKIYKLCNNKLNIIVPKYDKKIQISIDVNDSLKINTIINGRSEYIDKDYFSKNSKLIINNNTYDIQIGGYTFDTNNNSLFIPNILYSAPYVMIDFDALESVESHSRNTILLKDSYCGYDMLEKYGIIKFENENYNIEISNLYRDTYNIYNKMKPKIPQNILTNLILGIVMWGAFVATVLYFPLGIFIYCVLGIGCWRVDKYYKELCSNMWDPSMSIEPTPEQSPVTYNRQGGPPPP